MPRRKEPDAPVAPGPFTLEVRYGVRGEMTKIVCSQPVHSYRIDQTGDAVTIVGVTKLPKPEPAPEPEPVEVAPPDDAA